MTTWKWRDLNHQPFGESLYLLIPACVYVPVTALLGNVSELLASYVAVVNYSTEMIRNSGLHFRRRRIYFQFREERKN